MSKSIHSETNTRTWESPNGAWSATMAINGAGVVLIEAWIVNGRLRGRRSAHSLKLVRDWKVDGKCVEGILLETCFDHPRSISSRVPTEGIPMNDNWLPRYVGKTLLKLALELAKEKRGNA